MYFEMYMPLFHLFDKCGYIGLHPQCTGPCLRVLWQNQLGAIVGLYFPKNRIHVSYVVGINRALGASHK